MLAWFRPGSTAGYELRWRRLLSGVQTAVRDRQFDRIDGLLQDLEQQLEAFPLDDSLPPRWNRLGDLHQELSGSISDSERLYRRALALGEALPGFRSANVALSLNNLGLLLLHQRRFEEALPVLERLLPLVEEKFGAENSEVATCLENVAAALRGLGREEEARERRTRASSIRRQRAGPADKTPGRSARNSAGLRVRIGRVWAAGTVAGLILLGGELLLNGVLLRADWLIVAETLGLQSLGTLALLLALALTLLLGPGLIWVYVVLTAAFGADTRTAVLAGLIVWFPAFGYTCTWLAAFGVFPPAMMTVAAVWGLGETVLAALVGRGLYHLGAAAR